MPVNITIHDQNPALSDESSSLSDDEESSGVHVSPSHISPSSVDGSHQYSDPLDENERDWVYEIGPSESASRPRTSNHHRPIVEAPQPEPAPRQSIRRQHSHERQQRHPVQRTRRPHIPTSSGSVESNEDWPAYGHGPPQQYSRTYAHYGHAAPASLPNYAPSYSSAQGYAQFPTANVPPGQLVPFASPPAHYNYSPYQGAPGGQAPAYFSPGQHMAPAMGHPPGPHHGAPYTGQEVIHHTPAPAFYPYPPQGYPVAQAIVPPAIYPPYPAVYSPPPTNTPPPPAPPPAPPPVDSSKDDEKFARIEKLFLDQKAEQEAKEAAAKKAAEDAAVKAAADKKIADDLAAATKAAAAAATEEAEKKAADKAAEKAAEDAAKAKAAAEDAEKKAAEAAAAAAAVPPPPPPPPPPPEERKKPIRFKDAVGRKFSFPFHLCNTWEGMEDLIRQAFLHVEVIGPHVADGHYDLVGPNGEIILPQVWQTMIEPDWVITMHMWPMPEPPPPEPPPPEGAVDAVIDVPPKDGKVPPPPPPPPPGGKKKPVKKGGFLTWTAGKPKNPKPLKARRKPEDVAQPPKVVV
ncbi:MAG: hypothetical protein Q9170_005978 [Blastenia crenularia]